MPRKHRTARASKAGTPAPVQVPSSAHSPAQAPVLSSGKKVVFAFVTVCGFFVLLEGLLAVIGVRPVLYDQDPFVGFASNVPLFVEEAAPGAAYMVTSPNKIRWFNKQRFLKKKPAGSFRVFTLGGSTTYGHPYEDAASFSGWLREFLPVADPSKQWEVINCGGISYASYRVSVVMEELTKYEPDLFIIYTGENEFLERRTYQGISEAPRFVTEFGGLVSRTRLYSAAKKALDRPQTQAARPANILKSEVDTILAHSVGPRDYTRDDEQRQQVIAHFRFNLHRLIDIARSADAEVMFVTPASNLKDVSPFKSEHIHGLDSAARERFDSLYAAAAQERRKGNLEAALAQLDEARQIDDRYADLHYLRGLLLYDLGRYSESRESFTRAIDEDVCPLRIITPLQQTIAQITSERNVSLIQFTKLIEERAAHGVPGADWFLDHLHLNFEGYRLLALEIVKAMQAGDIIKPGNGWNETAIEAASRRVESRIDRQAQGVALRNLAKVFDWAGKQQEAERLAAQAAEVLGDDAESYNVLGRTAAARGDLDEAIRYLRKALEIKPDFVEPLTPLGIALGKQGKVDEAIALFRSAVEGKPDFSEAHYNLGFALMSKGLVDEAIVSYRNALAVDPDYAAAHNNLGTALIKQRRTDEAVGHFREALRLKPAYPEAHLNLGIALQSKGQTEEAMRQYREALRLNPAYAEALSTLSNASRAQGKQDEAIAQYREAVRLNPSLAEAHYNLAAALEANGNADEAILHYRQALEINPRSSETLSNLAVALMAKGETGEAVRYLKRAVEISPDSAEAYHNLGIAAAASGKTAEAIQHYRRALKLMPGHADAHSNLGAALMAQDKMSEAIDELQQAVGVNPRHAGAQYNLGVALGSIGEVSEAARHLREAVALDPNNARAHYYLANTLAIRGDRDKALQHLEKASQLAPAWPLPLTNRAWLLATGGKSGAQQGDQAIPLARRAVELTERQDVTALDALAASYATAGRFNDAVKTAEEALRLSSTAPPLTRQIRERLTLYEQGKPYRESLGSGAPR
jgi:tetratricopeptide (TPR) repeat protein